MRVGIVVEDTGLANIDFTEVEKGNPGVGGTVYEEILLANSLCSNRKYELVLYVTSSKNKYRDGLSVKVVESQNEIPEVAREDSIDILLYCTGKNRQWYAEVERCKIKSVAWVHGFLNYYELKCLRKIENITRVVFVGRNMYYSYIADDIIEKSTYIFNMYNSSCSPIRQEYGHDVCYLGALNRYKGFHMLAKAWPLVLGKVPDAKLYVIGRGDLYNRNSTLGKYGIAEKNYEKKFMKYITDENGEILPSIFFKGNMGEEKNKLISHMCVGVVNPTAITETFCISAIEINACGVPVCTKGKYGLLDTVADKKTGLYSNDSWELAHNIVLLLRNRSLNEKMSRMAIINAAKFNPDRIIPKWEHLLDSVFQNRKSEKPLITKDSVGILKGLLYKLRIEKGIRIIPSFIKFEYFNKNMSRVYFRDVIYHYLKMGA